jgi:branched-chain amino acid transport system ATP-binding protein
MSSSYVLEARKLGKSFAGLAALTDVSVAIGRGELVGVIGANGAGKTTFVNIVTGYVKPESGQVRFAGRDVTHLPPRALTRMGISRSFQVAQTFPELTALENILIALGAELTRSFWYPLRRPARVSQAMAALERFGIADYAEQKAASLPQGVRKLLDIAMAMSGSPQLVLLDEPTSGVSADEKFPLMDTLLGALDASRAGVLFVEHDMEIVARYAHRVVAFHEGRVIADGSPAEVMADEQVRTYVTGAIGTPAPAGRAARG